MIDVPFMKNSDIVKKAEEFLVQYNPQGIIPTPVEDIVEIKLKLDIFTIKHLFRNYGVSAALYKNLRGIYVDEDLASLNRVPHHYLYSLAHELGHLVFHREIYGVLPYDSVDSYIKCIEMIDGKMYGRMEYHAYTFAGLILVPPKPLKEHFKLICDQLKNEGYDHTNQNIIFWEFLVEYLKRIFQVSGRVIEKRIKFENLEI